MAQRLRGSLRETDVLARLGGDEFAILQSGEADQREARSCWRCRIIELIAEPFELDGGQVSVGTSIGIALAPHHGAIRRAPEKGGLGALSQRRPGGATTSTSSSRK